MEDFGGPSAVLSDLVSSVLFVLEMSGFGISLIDLIRDGVKGHDPLHEGCQDSGSKEADEDVIVCDASTGDVILEG